VAARVFLFKPRNMPGLKSTTVSASLAAEHYKFGSIGVTYNSPMPTLSEVLALAIQHHKAGRLQAAELMYRQILAVEPDQVDALHLIGVVAFQAGQHDAAAKCIRRAIELNGAEASFHYSLGNVFKTQHQLDDAIRYYCQALELKPGFAEAHNGLGDTFREKGDLDQAVAELRRAVELKPDFPEAHFNLGLSLLTQRQPEEAIAAYRQALQLRPDFVEAYNNLGNVWQALGNLEEAVTAYLRAAELRPDLPESYNNLGSVFHRQGKLDEAIAAFRRAIELKPNLAAAHSNLLYTLHFCPGHDAATIYGEHRNWNRQHAEPLAEFIRPHLNNANPNRRLRIGYVSANFRFHAGAFFLAPLFSAHSHQQFEIFCYSDIVWQDAITAKLRSYSDVWRNTARLSDERLVELIRTDQIDILVDLTMHMADGRPLLFARKPAPIQVCWLAYQGTTGMSTIDYRLTDSHLDPPGVFDHYYSEESIRLPDSFWCYDPLTNEPAVNPLPAVRKGYVTFGCLNNFCKVTDDVLRLWARVLRAVDRSRLILLAGEGSHRKRAIQFLERDGISRERITFHSFLPRSDYLRLYHEIDIGLDSFPYNGQTTTLDAVWMGVPVVTIIGQATSVARAGASVLRNLGTPELIAESPDQFVSIAVNLADDSRRLAELRISLRQRLEKSPLMDAPRFAANVESAYRSMWHRWCAARRDVQTT
jgi:predicted O-linked N-acetylglucosamine transferase (SPINDLY family)